MKDTLESPSLERAGNGDSSSPQTPDPRSGQQDGFSNRKLIRPALPPRHERGEKFDRSAERGERNNPRSPAHASKKLPPPNQTFAENFYYQKQMQSRTPMVVVLNDGEEIRGVIEWYDKTCIKLTRSGPHANLLIYKSGIKYLFKESESNGRK